MLGLRGAGRRCWYLLPDGGDGQEQVADLIFAGFYAAAFAEKQNGFRVNSASVNRQSGRRWATDSEVDDRDIIRCGGLHWPVGAVNRHIMFVGEHAHIIAEIDQQDVLADFRGILV